MYSYKSRIRYSELDETGHLRLEYLCWIIFRIALRFIRKILDLGWII